MHQQHIKERKEEKLHKDDKRQKSNAIFQVDYGLLVVKTLTKTTRRSYSINHKKSPPLYSLIFLKPFNLSVFFV
ncbi:CLUMA_CG015535, isoform A [Clunio marinus]|uniref:CLUMA_CG015535, isoform A n=1 Tax=Clunio marinus TaxID=568069 RepID=A0A1J1ISM0_9DIPT|nr:CLUMA_CG015535, isoform A [Clunio marinus]